MIIINYCKVIKLLEDKDKTLQYSKTLVSISILNSTEIPCTQSIK